MILVLDGPTYCGQSNVGAGCKPDLCTYVNALKTVGAEVKLAAPEQVDISAMECLVSDPSKDIFKFGDYTELKIENMPSEWLE